jgi:hypothetical protein
MIAYDASAFVPGLSAALIGGLDSPPCLATVQIGRVKKLSL